MIRELQVTNGSETTAELLLAACDGNRQALENLLGRYRPRVQEIVARRMGSRLRQLMDEEDLVQEVLMDVATSIKGMRERSEMSFESWLVRSAEGTIIDAVRRADAQKRGRTPERLEAAFPECAGVSNRGRWSPTGSALARAQELGERIVEALLTMPERCRDTIVLRRLCDTSYEEIAVLLGFKSEVAARKATSRALKQLADLVGEEG